MLEFLQFGKVSMIAVWIVFHAQATRRHFAKRIVDVRKFIGGNIGDAKLACAVRIPPSKIADDLECA